MDLDKKVFIQIQATELERALLHKIAKEQGRDASKQVRHWIKQSARSRNQDVNTLVQAFNLGILPNAAVNDY